MQYNNDLLKQLTDLEKRQDQAHREMQDKQSSLRQAVQMLDATRADAEDMKRKLAVAQEVAARATEEANRARVDAGIKAREADGLLRFAEEAKDEIASLKMEREDATRDLERVSHERDRLLQELQGRDDAENTRAAEHRADYEELSRGLAQAKARLGPLEAELKAERKRAEDLAEAVNRANAEARAAQEEAMEARSAMAQMQDQTRRAAQAEGQLKADIEERKRHAERTEGQVQAARELAQAAEQELEEARAMGSELSRVNRELEEEVRELKMQLEAVGTDLHSQTLARRQDRERLEARIGELQAEMQRVQDEARAREREIVADTSRREADTSKSRREWEDQHARLQEENRQLNELLQRQQREHVAKLEDFETAREQFEERIADAIGKQRQAEAAVSKRDAGTAQEMALLREKVVEAQQQLTQRTQIHVDTLSALENTVQQLAAECQRLQAAHDGLLDEVEVLRTAVSNHGDNTRPIEEWHAETKRGLVRLADAVTQAKEDANLAREAQISAEVQRDEERARLFMLEEERSRLEDEVRALQERLRALEQSSTERIKSARQDSDSAAAMRAELEGQVRRLQQQLDKANTQNRQLQESAEQATSALAGSQTKSRERVAELEQQAADLERRLRDAVNEKEKFEAERGLVKRQLETSSREIANLQEELRKAEAARQGRGEGAKDQASHQRQVALLTENMRKQATQLTQVRACSFPAVLAWA